MGSPLMALEIGAWLSLHSRINRLRPMAANRFRSETSATTSIVLFINASTLSEVVRQLKLDQSNGFNSGALSIEPFALNR